MPSPQCSSPFFFNDTATTEIYTLSLHDALPICICDQLPLLAMHHSTAAGVSDHRRPNPPSPGAVIDSHPICSPASRILAHENGAFGSEVRAVAVPKPVRDPVGQEKRGSLGSSVFPIRSDY